MTTTFRLERFNQGKTVLKDYCLNEFMQLYLVVKPI